MTPADRARENCRARHFHYPELLPDFIRRLNQNKNSFDLFLTTTTQAKAGEIASTVANCELKNVQITVGSNRGRDLAPFLKGLRDGLYSGYDVVGHFHGKRSPHVENDDRRPLAQVLVGAPGRWRIRDGGRHLARIRGRTACRAGVRRGSAFERLG